MGLELPCSMLSPIQTTQKGLQMQSNRTLALLKA